MEISWQSKHQLCSHQSCVQIRVCIPFPDDYSLHDIVYKMMTPITSAAARDIPIHQRAEFANKKCVEHNLRTNMTALNLTNHFVDHTHQVVYCAAPKTGSTNWLLMFAYLSGKVNISLTNQDDNEFKIWEKHSQYELGFQYLSDLSENRSSDILQRYYKFLFVRDPFYRLLSAYRDKFRPYRRLYYHQVYGKEIIRKYRHNATRLSLLKGNDVTFPEFIKFVIDSAKTHTLDPHWQPIYDMCFPCDIKYDMIGKMENFVTDTTLVLRQGFNITDRIKFPTNPGGYQTTRNNVEKFYSLIPEKDIEEIRRIFKYDFLLFGYPDVRPV